MLRCTPQQLSDFARRLNPDDLAELESVVAEIDAERHLADEAYAAARVPWRQNPALMAHHLEGSDYELYPYVEYLGHKARQLDTGEDPYQIWNLPSQYGKSKLGVRTLAYMLDRHPSNQYITTSYADELADRNGLETRDYLIAHGDALRVRLRRDAQRKDRFLTDEGGGVLAAGLFSSMVGFSADGIIVDDPYKGWQEAHSAAYRLRVSNTFKTVVWMRRRGGHAWVLIVMTRWHEQDLSEELGEAIGGELGIRFTVTRLPEVAESPDPNSPKHYLRTPDVLGRVPGQVLEPRRFSEEDVANKQKLLGPYLSAGLMQQRPAPAAGTEIMREWFKLGEELPRVADRAITSWDTKLKDKEAGDYVVGQCWWRVGGAYWCVDQLRGQWNQSTTKAAMALLAVRHPEVETHYFENKGNAPEVVEELRRSEADYEVPDAVAAALGMTELERELVGQLLRHGMSSMQPVNPVGEKSVRMRAVSPRIAGGDVWLPAGAHWVPAFLDEMASFPNGAHDDQVDCASQALSKLVSGAATISAAAGAVNQPRVGAGPIRVQGRGRISAPGSRRRMPGPLG